MEQVFVAMKVLKKGDFVKLSDNKEKQEASFYL